ncbi:MAG: hypothetical protein R2795_03420 [Saprospiraceae bacterium]
MKYIYLIGLLLLSLQSITAQRILLVEKVGNPKTVKLQEGSYIQYRLVDDESWYKDRIISLREDIQIIEFEDHLVSIDRITMMREHKPAARAFGTMLTTFGFAWSAFAAIGTATDGDPNSRYMWSDATVTGIAVGTGLLLPALFGTKKKRFGAKQAYRLRIIDVTF